MCSTARTGSFKTHRALTFAGFLAWYNVAHG